MLRMKSKEVQRALRLMKLLDHLFWTRNEATVISKPAKMKAIRAATFSQ